MRLWISRLFFLALVGVVFLQAPIALADHEGPERVVENRYVVTLLPTFHETETTLKFFFRDILTGKPLSVPVRFHITIEDEKTSEVIFTSPEVETTQGMGEMAYTFPHQGLYSVNMTFEKTDEPHKAFHPGPWPIWTPGSGPTQYPIGGSEIAGVGLFVLSILVVLTSVWWKKRYDPPVKN
jgi:hypothetical protein